MLQKSREFEVQKKYQKNYKKLKNFLALHTKRAYFVGGCVRDFYLLIDSYDFDIEVYDIDEVRFQDLMDDFGAVKVGKSFNVYKWDVFDIALPRTETKVGIGHTAFDTALSSDERTASIRRDFTMNALMLNIFTNELFDFWHGLDDIKNKTIRLIDEVRFAEDSLRVLRAVQFAARFGFRVEKNSIEVCKKISINDLSKTRIFIEFEKMFKSANLHYALYYLCKLDILNRLFSIKLSFEDFLKLSKSYKKNRQYIAKAQLEYFFLFSFYNLLHINLKLILEKLNAPKRYYKILLMQKRKPKIVSRKFLIAVSLKYPIKEWLGCDKEVINLAKSLSVFEESFSHSVLISAVIIDGFEKEDIKREYKKRICNALRAYSLNL